MLHKIYRQKKKRSCSWKDELKIGGAVASICLMIKKEILTLNVQTVGFLAKKKPSRKLDESAPTNMLRPNKDVVFQERLTKKSVGL